jgi:hypothetical protein
MLQIKEQNKKIFRSLNTKREEMNLTNSKNIDDNIFLIKMKHFFM